MHRSKDLKTSIFNPTRGGRYQAPAQLILRAREGEGEGGEGEGGEGGEQLTAGQITQMNTIIHKAIGSRLSSQSFKDSIGTIAGAAAATAMEGFSGKLDELIAAKVTPDPDDKGKGGKPPEGGSWKDSPEYKDMLKREEARDAAAKKIEDERAAEKETGYRNEERKELEAALRKAGIEEVKLRSCVATLIHEDKVMQRDANGDVVYRVQRDDFFDDMGVHEGVKEFLGTDEGKAFLPASGAGGTGVVGNSDNKGQNSQRKGKGQTKDEAAAVVSAWLGGGGVG